MVIHNICNPALCDHAIAFIRTEIASARECIARGEYVANNQRYIQECFSQIAAYKRRKQELIEALTIEPEIPPPPQWNAPDPPAGAVRVLLDVVQPGDRVWWRKRKQTVWEQYQGTVTSIVPWVSVSNGHCFLFPIDPAYIWVLDDEV